MTKKAMSEFTYKGLLFKPLRNLKGGARSWKNVSKRIKDVGITPRGWNHAEFYEIAKENNAYVDLFEVYGVVVIPATNFIFKYD